MLSPPLTLMTWSMSASSWLSITLSTWSSIQYPHDNEFRNSLPEWASADHDDQLWDHHQVAWRVPDVGPRQVWQHHRHAAALGGGLDPGHCPLQRRRGRGAGPGDEDSHPGQWVSVCSIVSFCPVLLFPDWFNLLLTQIIKTISILVRAGQGRAASSTNVGWSRSCRIMWPCNTFKDINCPFHVSGWLSRQGLAIVLQMIPLIGNQTDTSW